MSDLLHSAVLAGVDVEPVHMQSVYTLLTTSEDKGNKYVPVRLVVRGREIALLDHTVLLGKVGFGERLSWSTMFTRGQQAVHKRSAKKGVSYGFIRRIANLLANKLVHPLVGLVIVATVGREAGNDERHVC